MRKWLNDVKSAAFFRLSFENIVNCAVKEMECGVFMPMSNKLHVLRKIWNSFILVLAMVGRKGRLTLWVEI